MNNEQWLWTEKFRPSKIEDCILPENIKEIFQSFVKEKNIPNLLIVGSPGVGKTSAAIAMIEEIDGEWIKVNSSLDRGIDVIRNEIAEFASSVSFKSGRKYIVLDEADGLTTGAQDALKSFIEEFSSNAGFILTCNSKDKIIEAIQSRCSLITIILDKENFPKLANQFMNSVIKILNQEEISYDKRTLALVIQKFYPDWRRTIGEIQTYSMANKTIDSGILSINKVIDLIELIGFIKSKNWSEMRKWVGENYYSISDFNDFANKLFIQMKDGLQRSCYPAYVLLYNRYDYQNYFVIDKETNIVAFITELMSEMIF
jgi:DNA polymerase III delta prime subunit